MAYEIKPYLENVFNIEISVGKPVVVGQDDRHGRRQLIEILEGTVSGKLNGKVMTGGVDSQVIRPDGMAELGARYGLELDDGEHVYIDNRGIRRVDPEFAPAAARGEIVDPSHVYFATVATFEVFSEKYRWLEQSLFVSCSTRLPDKVIIRFYEVKM